MGLFSFLQRQRTRREADLALVIDSDGEFFVTEHAAWHEVAEAVEAIHPTGSPILVRPDGEQIRADGARAKFTIAFRPSADADPLLVGRPTGGKQRGRAEVQEEMVLVTPLEWWSHDDGIEVFERFYKGEVLATRFVLRDPSVRLSREEIAAVLGG